MSKKKSLIRDGNEVTQAEYNGYDADLKERASPSSVAPNIDEPIYTPPKLSDWLAGLPDDEDLQKVVASLVSSAIEAVGNFEIVQKVADASLPPEWYADDDTSVITLEPIDQALLDSVEKLSQRIARAMADDIREIMCANLNVETYAEWYGDDDTDIDPSDPAYNGAVEYLSMFGDADHEALQKALNDWRVRTLTQQDPE